MRVQAVVTLERSGEVVDESRVGFLVVEPLDDSSPFCTSLRRRREDFDEKPGLSSHEKAGRFATPAERQRQPRGEVRAAAAAFA
jgi:hypothetical protein